MGIKFTGIQPKFPRPKAPRPNRSIGFDNEVRRYADAFISRQGDGYITSRDLTVKLNEDGVRSKDGKPWSESKVFRMLRRGAELGLPFKLRSRSDAATRRRVRRRSAGEIAASRSGPMPEVTDFAQSDAGITSTSALLLKGRIN